MMFLTRIRARVPVLVGTVALAAAATSGTAAGTATAASAHTGANTGNPAAPAPALTPEASGGVLLDAGYLRVGMDSTGEVTSLVDTRTAQDYIATGQGTAPLVSLVINGKQVPPTSLTLSGSNTLIFKNAAAGSEVDVAVGNETTYSTLTVTKVSATRTSDIQTLLWGPLATDITESLGETVGVVRNDDFAIGMQPLTDRTEGGWPVEDTDAGWDSQVVNNPSGVSVGPLSGWSIGARTSWGTLLRAFTFDYTKQRERLTEHAGNPPAYPIPVGPLPGGEGSVVGSKIALFGTAPDTALTVLSGVATGQALPYPTFDGQWQKASQASSQSMLVFSDLDTADVNQAAAYAKAAGIDYIYSKPSKDGPWQSAGHYQFDSDFGGGDGGAAALVDHAKTDGVDVGVHTLSDFIDSNDPYVTPTPSSELSLGLKTTLAEGLTATDTTAHLSSCAPLAGGLDGKMLLIGDEYITYTGYTQSGGECEVTGLSRAQWGSTAAAHPAGTGVGRLSLNEYGGALGGLDIINAIADRFAAIQNTVGIKAMSFDGLESASQSGWGGYGIDSLVNGTYDGLTDTDGYIWETSRMTSNIWNAMTRASWGELGSSEASLLTNNAYYQANYLPGALGWISVSGSESLLTLNQTLALAAGLNAGVDYRVSVSNLSSGSNTSAVLNDIDQWERARNLGAFTPAQRVELQNLSAYWTLSTVTPGRAWSLQQVDASGKPIGSPQSVVAPAPAFTTTSLPAFTTGRLYEAVVATNVPSTIRYSVTSGALPAGLKLNRDTGGITGVPVSDKPTTFTVTGYGAPGTANARNTFTIAPAADSPAGAFNR